MTKWEYELVSFNTFKYFDGHSEIMKEINKLGNEGWEAVGICLNYNQWTKILFKRKKS